MVDSKIIFGVVSVAFTLSGSIPYFYGIFKQRIKPHTFTWLLWFLTTGITAAAQLYGDGGPGAWPMAIASVLNFIIFALSLKYGETNITRVDWYALILGLGAIPLWLVTKNPLWSVILVTAIDTVAYVPTIRKSWRKPYEEAILTYVIGLTAQGLSLLALRHVTLITALAPAVYFTVNVLFVGYVLCMRRIRREMISGANP